MLYEIEIHRNDYTTPVDMQKVYAALQEAHLDFDAGERRQSLAGVAEENPEYVYVDGCVSDAVRVINELGYTTDEDEGDEDEEEFDIYEGLEDGE